MEHQVLDDVAARRFLLGQLPPEEQGRIEELAFKDPDTFEFLESIEDDLIDEFIRGDLSADERQRFEKHVLTLPGRRNDLKISRVLQLHFNEAEDKKFSFPIWFNTKPLWLRVSLGLTVVVAGGALVVILIRQATQPAPIQAGPDKPRAVTSPEFRVSPSLEPTASPAHVENKQKIVPPEKQKKVAAYAVLMPSAEPRGEGMQQLKLAPDASTMAIELPIITQTNFAKYEATLENEAGTAELQRWPNLKAAQLPNGKGVKIDVPASLLTLGKVYRFVVSGVSSEGKAEVIGRYPFQVVVN